MADSVASRTIVDGSKLAVLQFTNVSDGTGESAVKKVDVSALLNSPSEVKITRIWFSTLGMGVQILFDATANALALSLGSDSEGFLDFRSFGGLPNTAGTGKTGDILFTTVGHTSGDSYSVILEVSKS